MTRNTCFISVGILALLLALMMPGATAATANQPGYIVVGIAPIAQFDAHYAFATVPTKVNFVDNSMGSTPMTYQWISAMVPHQLNRIPRICIPCVVCIL